MDPGETEPAKYHRSSQMMDLVTRAQSGDRAAFDALYRVTVNRVYAVCLRMSGSVEEAERLTQDTYVRVWQRLDSFRGESAFTSWLHRLVVNCVLEDARATKRREDRVLNVEEPAMLESTRFAPTAHHEDRVDLERAIAALPRGARQILVLHDIEGFKHEEIAEMLGITSGGAKAQLHRARQLLRKALDA